MNIAEATSLFAKRAPALEALGQFVVQSVRDATLSEIAEQDRYGFFKIDPAFRVKDVASFREKIERQGKNYSDPLSQITDQVGTRFIVLLSDQVKLVNRIIAGIPIWKVTRARDVEREREENPHHFDYLSDHWVVSLRKTTTWNGVEIPADMPCEIQVRTLLQHAYAELAHATIYKPNLTAKPDVRRAIAKGAALVETTDEVFGRVADKIAEHMAVVTKHLKSAENWFVAHVSAPDYCRGNEIRAMRVLDAFAQEFQNDEWKEIEVSFSTRSYLSTWLLKSREIDPFFAHPVILLVFWLVDSLQHDCVSRWPLDLNLLNPVFTVLGISSDEELY